MPDMSNVRGLFSRLAMTTRDIATKVKDEYTHTFEELGCHIVQIRPSLVVVESPSDSNRHWIAFRLNREYSERYLLLNFSGQSYDEEEFLGNVLDVPIVGPVPEMHVLVQLCTAVSRWLTQDTSNVVVAHGTTEDSAAAAFFFACYLSWAELCPHPVAGLLEVCGFLSSGGAHVAPSHNRYLGYFELLQRDYSLHPAILTRAKISGIRESVQSRSLLAEVWQQDQILHSAVLKSIGEAGADLELEVSTPCSGDLRIVVRDFLDGTGAALMQVCFNTGFAAEDGALHFGWRDIDCLNAELSLDVFMDVFLAPGGANEAKSAERLSLQVLLGAESARAAKVATPLSALLMSPSVSAQKNLGMKEKLEPLHFDLTADDDEEDGTAYEFFDLLESTLCASPRDAQGAPKAGADVAGAPPPDIDAFFRELDALAQL